MLPVVEKRMSKDKDKVTVSAKELVLEDVTTTYTLHRETIKIMRGGQALMVRNPLPLQPSQRRRFRKLRRRERDKIKKEGEPSI